MRALFSEQKQKILSVLIASVVSFLGFEALSYILGTTYQLNYYGRVAVEIYLFHIFWLTFLFDLHFKKRGILGDFSMSTGWLRELAAGFRDRVAHLRNWHYLRHYINFLILPSILYWSAVLLMSINPFTSELKQLVILTTSICLAIVYWHLREIYSKNFELHHLGIKILSLVKIFAAFLFYAAVVGQTFYFGFGPNFLFWSVSIVTFFLIYQALFQHHMSRIRNFGPVILISLVMGAVSYWIYQTWSYQYLTAALVMAAIYNTAWGILHHHLEKTLTRRLAMEYILILIVALSILLASNNFTGQVL